VQDGVKGWSGSADAWIAEQGDSGDWSRREILDPALEPVFAKVAGKRVLDVGCGEGRYARLLSGRGATVVGIDPTPELLAVARRRHPAGDYRPASGESLPFGEAEFDVVLCYLSLVDIADDSSAIAEMCRVVRPGGEVVLVTISNVASTTAGWTKDSDGKKLHRTVDRYMECFPLRASWRGIDIVNWHRPLSRTMGAFLKRGMRLTRFLEPLPAPESPGYEAERRAPTFQILTWERM